jgi:TetR/AcrR family transcriptional repressor of nem operon
MARVAGNGEFSEEILNSGREAVLGRAAPVKRATKKPAAKKAATGARR